MGRKSLKEERVSEILRAFEHCLETKGLQATTLDDIAEASGMARRMVRHYIGNREDVIKAGVTHILEKFDLAVEHILQQSNTNKRIDIALDYLFSEQFNDHPSTKHVAALLPVSLYDTNVCEAVRNIYLSFLEGIEKELRLHKPGTDSIKLRQTAYSIMCLSFGGGWMRNIGFNHQLNDKNKHLAKELIQAL